MYSSLYLDGSEQEGGTDFIPAIAAAAENYDIYSPEEISGSVEIGGVTYSVVYKGAVPAENFSRSIKTILYRFTAAASGAYTIITASSPVTVVENAHFGQNSAVNHGGSIYNSENVTIADNAFSGNTAGYNGGALYNGKTMTVQGAEFSGNRSTGTYVSAASWR